MIIDFDSGQTLEETSWKVLPGSGWMKWKIFAGRKFEIWEILAAPGRKKNLDKVVYVCYTMYRKRKGERNMAYIKYYPCDAEGHICPYDAIGGDDCRWYCGLGCDEDSYDPSDDYDTNFYEDGDCQ